MLVVPGDAQKTLHYCAEHFIDLCKKAVSDHGAFYVALSGGSTPKALFQLLTTTYASQIPWEKVHLYWSDERCVLPTDPESNYHMAMQAGLSRMPIAHIHRMEGEKDPLLAAAAYDALLQKHPLDLVMLGLGEDGHTASLFPHTAALHVRGPLCCANYVPQKQTWRLTLTYTCIEKAHHTVIYVLGASKAPILHTVLTAPLQPELYPIQRLTKALWIADLAASHHP